MSETEAAAPMETATTTVDETFAKKDTENGNNSSAEDEDKVAQLKEAARNKEVVMNGSNGDSLDSAADTMSNGVHEDEEVKDKKENGSKNDNEDEDIQEVVDSSDIESVSPSASASASNSRSQSPSSRPEAGSSSRRKMTHTVRMEDIGDSSLDDEEVEEEEDVDDEEGESDDDDDDDDGDVQEVKDSSDSDIMEVDAEDPLGGGNCSGSEFSSSSKATLEKKPNVVTIDDVKTLQALASNAKKQQEDKPSVVLIDTNTILAGKATSGVTITPAKPKISLLSSSSSSASATIGSGVTISASNSTNSTSFNYDKKGQLNDPNLTDDTFVVEAPSFIVPYVYEKPPKETFDDFKAAIKKMMDEQKKKDEEEAKKVKKDKEKAKEDKEKAKEEKKKEKKLKKKLLKQQKKKEKKGDDESGEDNGDKDPDDEDFEVSSDEDSDDDSDDDEEEANKKKEQKSDDDDDDSDDDDEVVEVRGSSPALPEKKKPSDNFFESSLGKFISDLGMNMVQEVVQHDLLKQQQKKARKDKSAAVMHAIMSLKKNIEQSKEQNEAFHVELKKCKFCSFRTESQLALEHHLETPHMKHMQYRCNFCPYETKLPQEVLTHMMTDHGVRAKLERAPALHQCPQCPFEDNMKGKLTRHKAGCDKRYRGERNMEPPHDWEPPAKIPKPPQHLRGGNANSAGNRSLIANNRTASAMQQFHQQGSGGSGKNVFAGMPTLQFGPRGGRGRPTMSTTSYRPFNAQQQFMSQNRANTFTRGINSQVVMQALGQGRNAPRAMLLPNLGANSSVTIQSINQRNSSKSSQPSISITPLPGKGGARPGGHTNQQALKPGQPGGQGGRGGFVICEICDGYIRDLEQLRNHMQWIHKVKIHAKMIYNRPPLNCQKCQFRFFTDQGLERHLLGSHGLVTASMQDLANRSQDSGRCPVCGKVFQWKLLNHVAKDHQKTLKPAHLSYKCTVCTATFGQYKLFENHVYTAHSAGSRRSSQAKPPAKPSILGNTIKMSDEITIIPQGKTVPAKKPTLTPVPAAASSKKPAADPDIIEIDDDEEEEIDDVEDHTKSKSGSESGKSGQKRGAETSATASDCSGAEEPVTKKSKSSEPAHSTEESGDEGVEEIEDEEPEDDDDDE